MHRVFQHRDPLRIGFSMAPLTRLSEGKKHRSALCMIFRFFANVIQSTALALSAKASLRHRVEGSQCAALSERGEPLRGRIGAAGALGEPGGGCSASDGLSLILQRFCVEFCNGSCLTKGANRIPSPLDHRRLIPLGQIQLGGLLRLSPPNWIIDH